MDGWSKLCRDEDVVGVVLERVKAGALCERMRRAVRMEVERPGVRLAEVEKTVYDCIVSSDLHVQLKNAVFKELIQLQGQVGVVPTVSATPPPQLKEPLDFLREAQEEWEGKLRRGINALCTDQGVPLARERTKQESDAVRKRWNAIGSDFSGLDKQHPIYSPKDFLEVLIRIKSINFTPSGSFDNYDDSCGLMSFNLNIKSLYELREQFSCLSPSHLQLETAPANNCETEYNDKTVKVLRMGLCSLSRQRCRTGCPISHRRALWCSAMAVDTSRPQHAFHFEELRSAVLCSSLLFDRLLAKDVKKTAANDDSFFVFEDTMHQILLCFLRDSSLLKHYKHLSITPMKTYIKGNVGQPEFETVYPPSGVIPFHGFSLYVAPLCFLFDRPDHLYSLFSEMYSRYFVHLHSISSHRNGIVSLCCQFEALLQARQPELFQHLSRIKAHPLRLVFGWLVVAFAGRLDARELLLLWDRVIGYNSTTILAVLAVAVLEFRATNLFKVSSLSEAEAVLTDLRCLKVLPLIQQTLFL